MTPHEKAEAKRFNEAQRAIGSFCGNASIGFFASAFGIWYDGKPGTISVIIGAALLGMVFVSLSIAAPGYMRDEE